MQSRKDTGRTQIQSITRENWSSAKIKTVVGIEERLTVRERSQVFTRIKAYVVRNLRPLHQSKTKSELISPDKWNTQMHLWEVKQPHY